MDGNVPVLAAGRMMTATALPMRLAHAAVMVKQEPDDDSDMDEPNLLLKKLDSTEAQIIHSGHFMVSSPHSEHPPKKGYDFDTVNEKACQTYSFGKTSTCHLSIDASLTKLLECMTLAYRYCAGHTRPVHTVPGGTQLPYQLSADQCSPLTLCSALCQAMHLPCQEHRLGPCLLQYTLPILGDVFCF